MELNDVIDEIKNIRILATVGDYEAAHAREDDLRLAILRHHADAGCELSQKMLELNDDEFCRHCAQYVHH